MRLFIAVDVPPEVSANLLKLQEGLKVDYAKQTFPKSHHLTLKFLGEVDDLDSVRDRLSAIKFKPFKLSLDRMGVFPNEDYIKVTWVGLEPEDEIKKLAADIEEALSEFNFKKDFDFSPHITLSRVKFVDKKEEFKQLLKMEVPKHEFEVTEFKLIKSELLPEGPIYSDVEVFKAE